MSFSNAGLNGIVTPLCALRLSLLLIESEYPCREIDIGECEAHCITPAYAREAAKEKRTFQSRVLSFVVGRGKTFDFLHRQYLFFQSVHITVNYNPLARILFHQSFLYSMEYDGSEHIVRFMRSLPFGYFLQIVGESSYHFGGNQLHA